MIDEANLLAALAEASIDGERFRSEAFRFAFGQAAKRRFHSRIYGLTKTQIDQRVYVTDARGTVLFDSDQGKEEGKDYSQWRDVYLTLRGHYGARSTRLDP